MFNQMCWEHWNDTSVYIILVLHSSEFEHYWRMLNSCLTTTYLQFRCYKRTIIIVTSTLSNALESLTWREHFLQRSVDSSPVWINFYTKVIGKNCPNLWIFRQHGFSPSQHHTLGLLKVFKSGEREKFYKEVWTVPFMP